MISINGKRVANAVGNKTARPCDSCIKKRARWYCAADDAFLCQSCDSSVHSANPLARRHERVRLKSLDLLVAKGVNENGVGAKKKAPSWHEGFTKKARTPRHGKSSRNSDDSPTSVLIRNILQVPEDGSDDLASHEENEDEIEQQLLYRVPVFDPMVPVLYSDKSSDGNVGDDNSSVVSSDGVFKISSSDSNENISDCSLQGGNGGNVGRRAKEEGEDEETFKGILPSEMDLAEFAADVEILFGRGLERESCILMEELGIGNSFKEEKEVDYYRTPPSFFKVKVEESDQDMVEQTGVERITKELLGEIDLEREGDGGMTLDLDLDFPHDDQDLSPVSSAGGDDMVEKKVILGMGSVMALKSMHVNGGVGVATQSKKIARRKMKILLSLDYEAVISAWGHTGGSPWTTGSRPDFDIDECWPDYMGTFGSMELPQLYRDHRLPPTITGVGHSAAMVGDGGREARVLRYREKRRTRLFSKKIRYEVRKLNAEKRPRMKGRFVKRAAFAESPAVPHHLLK